MTQAESGAFLQRRREEQREARRVVRDTVRAIKNGDRAALPALLEKVDIACVWQEAFRAIVREADNAGLDSEMQAACLRIWIHEGDHLRQEVGDDRMLVRALRVLLPPYQGPAMTLFRGDSAYNRKCRTYGLAWTSDRAIAAAFAENGYWRTFEGGSAVLQTIAPSDSIICAPCLHDDRYGETEYLVDPPLPHHGHRAAAFYPTQH
jgi:hypothetical protein